MSQTHFKLALLGFFGALSAYPYGPPPSMTGAPGEGNCTACHRSYPVNSGPGMLTIDGFPGEYSPGEEVSLTVTLRQPNRFRFGFQLTALDESGGPAGTLVVRDPERTQLNAGAVGGVLRTYIEHTRDGAYPTGPDRGSWSFVWRAPAAASAGPVTFYIAGNAADGVNVGGDFIYTAATAIRPAAPRLSIVSAANFAATALAPEALAAAFGRGLAVGVEAASALPLPTSLLGTTVAVRDSAGIERLAPLLFVSPAQVNYQIPPGTATGEATVLVTGRDGSRAIGTARIAAVAPGLFSADASGRGLAAATVLRVKADGSQQYEPVARYDAATQRFIAAPVDLGEGSDQVFLVLYGTGWRHRSSLPAVAARIGGLDAPVTFAGPAPGFAGLDQLNLLLPRDLAGRGEVGVALAADGVMANAVSVVMR